MMSMSLSFAVKSARRTSLQRDLVLAAKAGLYALLAAKLGMAVIYVLFRMLKMAELHIINPVLGAELATAFRWRLLHFIMMIVTAADARIAFFGCVMSISPSLKQFLMLWIFTFAPTF